MAASLSWSLPLGLALIGVVLTGLWAWEARSGPVWPPLLGLGAWLAYAAWGWAGARRERQGQCGELAWDGQAWYWRPAAGGEGGPDEAIAGLIGEAAQGALQGALERAVGAASRPVRPEVCLDLQRLLLLRMLPVDPKAGPQAGPKQWLWLTPGRDPGRWRALRRALYSTRSRPAQ